MSFSHENFLHQIFYVNNKDAHSIRYIDNIHIIEIFTIPFIGTIDLTNLSLICLSIILFIHNSNHTKNTPNLRRQGGYIMLESSTINRISTNLDNLLPILAGYVQTGQVHVYSKSKCTAYFLLAFFTKKNYLITFLNKAIFMLCFIISVKSTAQNKNNFISRGFSNICRSDALLQLHVSTVRYLIQL